MKNAVFVKKSLQLHILALCAILLRLAKLVLYGRNKNGTTHYNNNRGVIFVCRVVLELQRLKLETKGRIKKSISPVDSRTEEGEGPFLCILMDKVNLIPSSSRVPYSFR